VHIDFSSNASVYDRRHGTIMSDQLAQSMRDCLVPGTTVVDIGAGTGRVVIALGRNGFRVVAIDPAIPMLQCCGESLVNCRFRPSWRRAAASRFKSGTLAAWCLSCVRLARPVVWR
jgi:ubiquinone/menaquinone biosynthesis C-methylase UbiE